MRAATIRHLSVGVSTGLPACAAAIRLKAMICFEEATGSRRWQCGMISWWCIAIGGRSVRGIWQALVSMECGKHQLFTAKLIEASAEVSADVFSVPTGATEVPAGTFIVEQVTVIQPWASPTIKRRGWPRLAMQSSTGSAQIGGVGE